MSEPAGQVSAAKSASEQGGTPNADRMSSVRPGGNRSTTLFTWDWRSGFSLPGSVIVAVGAVRTPACVVVVCRSSDGLNGTAEQFVGVKLDCAAAVSLP